MIGLILLIVGALALGYQGFTYVTTEKVVDAGPVQISADKAHYVWIPPVVGAIAVVGGLVLLASGSRRPA